jgi:hypothetical protein
MRPNSRTTLRRRRRGRLRRRRRIVGIRRCPVRRRRHRTAVKFGRSGERQREGRAALTQEVLRVDGPEHGARQLHVEDVAGLPLDARRVVVTHPRAAVHRVGSGHVGVHDDVPGGAFFEELFADFVVAPESFGAGVGTGGVTGGCLGEKAIVCLRTESSFQYALITKKRNFPHTHIMKF